MYKSTIPQKRRADSPDPAAALLGVILFLRVVMPPSVYEWTGYMGNAALCLLVLYLLVKDPREFKAGDNLVFGGAVLYFASMFFTIPRSLAPADSLYVFLKNSGGFFILLAGLSLGTRRLKWILGAFLFAFALSAAFALRQHFGGFEKTLAASGISDYARETLREGRVFGLTMSPDMLAVTMAAAIPVVLSMLFPAGVGSAKKFFKNRKTPAFGLLLILFASVLLLTRSLGGVLAAGAGLLAWFFLKGLASPESLLRRQWKKFAVLLTILLIGGCSAVVVLRGGHFLEFEGRHNPLVMRLHNWEAAVRLFAEFPLTGAGAGQYGAGMLKHRSMTGNEAQHAHNSLLEALSETGIPGFIGLALLFVGFLRRAFLTARPSAFGTRMTGETLWICIGAFSGAVALMAHSFIDFSMQVPEAAALFWLAAGVAASQPSDKGQQIPWPRKTRFLVIAAAAALLVTFAANMYHMQAERIKQEARRAAAGNDWTTALKKWEAALEWRSRDREALVRKARALAFSKQGTRNLARARAALRRAVFLEPRYPFVYEYYGHVLAKSEPARAEKMFVQAVSLYPNSMELNLTLGEWFIKQKRYDKAEEVLRHAAGCGSSNGDVLFQLSRLYFIKGDLKQGSAFLKRSAFAPPVMPARAKQYVLFMLKQDKTGKARDFVSRWKRRNPEHTGALRDLERRLSEGAGTDR